MSLDWQKKRLRVMAAGTTMSEEFESLNDLVASLPRFVTDEFAALLGQGTDELFERLLRIVHRAGDLEALRSEHRGAVDS